MKRRLACLWLGAVGLLPFTVAWAENDSPRASIRVDVQMVSVSPAAALSLVPALSDEKTIEESNARLLKMIADGEATLLGWPILWLQTGISANRAAGLSPWELAALDAKEQTSSWTIEECRYPTNRSASNRRRLVEAPTDGSSEVGRNRADNLESRNLGNTLEAKAEVDPDGRTVSLTLAPAFVRLIEFHRFRNQTSPLGISGEMSQPEFLVTSAQTRIRIRNGHLALLNVFVVPKPEPHVELFLVRVKATLLDTSKSIPSKK